MKITIDLQPDDFDRLWDNHMKWGSHWQEQAGRFEVISQPWSNEPVYWPAEAYWFGDIAKLIFARSFLEAEGTDYQVLQDKDDGTYVIITWYR